MPKKFGGWGTLNHEFIEEFILCCKLCGKRIVFAVGNITENKNQKQLAEAVGMLNSGTIAIIFGREADGGELWQTAKKHGLQSRVILAGYSEQVSDLWQYADLNTLLSINEGFGLSVIEGYVHGVPSVIFGDIDAASDLYDEKAMIKIKGRTTADAAEAIRAALNKEWNKEEIAAVGKRFSIENMTEKYISCYKKKQGYI